MQPEVAAHSHAPAPQTTQVAIALSTGNSALELKPDSLRYAEAMQNYVTLVFVQNNELQKEVVRSTIASIEAQFANSSIIRCHRSYLVNVDAIEQVSGNAQGLKLQLHDVPGQEIPVSRSRIATVRALLKK